jgi:hypothetical protein
VNCSDGALRFEPIYGPEPGQDVHAEAEQTSDIT